MFELHCGLSYQSGVNADLSRHRLQLLQRDAALRGIVGRFIASIGPAPLQLSRPGEDCLDLLLAEAAWPP
ncbi:MAG: hypothetical protein ACOCYC_03165 [bacterium]